MLPMTSSSVVIRPAVQADHENLLRLAQLDAARPLTGDVLLAERDGRPVAALAVARGEVVADPFEPTAAEVELLRTRARTLVRRGRDRALGLRTRLA
jgi:hypothetical protein